MLEHCLSFAELPTNSCSLKTYAYNTLHVYSGPFHRCVATLMARMGQCFSTSTDTIAVVQEETGIEFEDIDDVEIRGLDQTYTFSDGVGRISSNLAKKVSIEF